jgi:hypothetical protein
MFVEKYLICPEDFFGMSGKKFLVTFPPPSARQHFWGEILMFSLPVRGNYTVPPKQD